MTPSTKHPSQPPNHAKSDGKNQGTSNSTPPTKTPMHADPPQLPKASQRDQERRPSASSGPAQDGLIGLDCGLCKKKGSSTIEMIWHYGREHSESPIFIRAHLICGHPPCKQAFNKAKNYLEHVRQAHGIEYPQVPSKIFILNSRGVSNAPPRTSGTPNNQHSQRSGLPSKTSGSKPNPHLKQLPHKTNTSNPPGAKKPSESSTASSGSGSAVPSPSSQRDLSSKSSLTPQGGSQGRQSISQTGTNNGSQKNQHHPQAKTPQSTKPGSKSQPQQQGSQSDERPASKDVQEAKKK